MGAYKFDAETIKSKIAEWEQFLADLRKDHAVLRAIPDGIQAPSADQPAVQQVAATIRSVNAAREHNERMQKYAQAYVDALHKANGTYSEHETDVATGIYGNDSATNGLYQ